MKRIKNSDIEYLYEGKAELAKFGEQALELMEEVNAKIKDIIDNTTCSVTDLSLPEIIKAFNEKKETIADQLNEITDEMDGYYDDRSEKWKNSQNGECFLEWMEEWKSIEPIVTESCIEIKLANSELIDIDQDLDLDIGVTDDFDLPSQTPEI